MYFKGTTFFAFIVPSLLVLSINIDLNLNDLDPVKVSCGISLQNLYKLLNVFE